jgi:hypothetical protein
MTRSVKIIFFVSLKIVPKHVVHIYYICEHLILPLDLYGCETWSLTLKEERRLRVSENRVLRRIFGLRRDEVTGDWRKLQNEELNGLYSSTSIVRLINREERDGRGM